MPAPGSCANPAYRAPVKPASGLFPVPAAILDGTPGTDGVGVVPDAVLELCVVVAARWLLAALLTR